MNFAFVADRWTPARRAALVLGALLVSATSASAQQIHSFPGSMCQASGSAQDLYYSGTVIANRTDATNSAVCPVPRSNGTAPWLNVGVFVRDRHPTQNIVCVAEARALSGVAGIGWSQTLSTAGEGDQVLMFGAPGGPVPNYGPYVVTCSLPAMAAPNQPSYIAAYGVIEP